MDYLWPNWLLLQHDTFGGNDDNLWKESWFKILRKNIIYSCPNYKLHQIDVSKAPDSEEDRTYVAKTVSWIGQGQCRCIILSGYFIWSLRWCRVWWPGDFLAVATWFLPYQRFDWAGLLAIRNGIYLLANLGCNNEEIESDCSFAVETIQQMDSYLGPGVAFVSECIQLAMGFAKISFRHCFREAN